MGTTAGARDAAARAFELSANLPRADRLLVEGTYREMSSAWKEAIAIWQTLSTFFPDDVEHALRLANAQISSGAAKDGLATIEGFRKRFPSMTDPRLDLAEAEAADTLSDFKRMQAAASSAAATGEKLGARLLVANARLRQGGATLRQGQTDEAVKLFEEARAIYAAAGDKAGVARTLNNLATAISDGPDTKRTNALYEEGLRIARSIGEQDLVARFLNNIAVQERRAGNLHASLKLNQESLAIRREIGDRTNAAISLNNIGNVLLDLGDLQGASRHYEESAAMSRETGDRRGLARALYNAGESFKLQGEIARARTTYEEALSIRRTIEDPASVATSLYGVGHIAGVQGDLATAEKVLSEALETDRRLDRRRPMAYSTYQLGDIALMRGDFALAKQRHNDALAIRTALGEKGTAAESRSALAVIALEEGRAADAEKLAADAATVFAAQSAPDNEAMARAVIALAMLTQGRRATAIREIERAQSLIKSPQHVLARMPVMIAAARVNSEGNPAAALSSLESIRADAVKRGIARSEFDARRAIAQIEGRRSLTAGAKSIETLRKDANARGFGLYVRLTSEPAQQRAPTRHARPRDRQQNHDHRQTEEDHRQLVLLSGVGRLADLALPHVREGNADQHAGDVLDREESQRRIAHRGAHVGPRVANERAEPDVEQQPDQELHVERDAEPAHACRVARTPVAATCDSCNRPRDHHQAGDDDDPTKKGMNQQECGVHVRIVVARQGDGMPRPDRSRYLCSCEARAPRARPRTRGRTASAPPRSGAGTSGRAPCRTQWRTT